jgi:DNA-directed RNA polymerase specialized sigma subunit
MYHELRKQALVMIEPSLNQLEREVEASRTKLASDLSTLRSPEFTENLKREAIDYKDALLDKAKASAQSSIESLIEDVKARRRQSRRGSGDRSRHCLAADTSSADCYGVGGSRPDKPLPNAAGPPERASSR